MVKVNVLEMIEKLYWNWIMKIKKLNKLIIIEGKEFKILIDVWIMFVS